MTNSKLNANDVVDGLYSYLKKNESEELLPEIIKILNLSKVNDEEAIITTAITLDNAKKLNAKKLAIKLIKKDDLQFSFVTDSAIIDGLKINYKDKVWDLTLKSQLTKLLNQITK
jgi:F0F1-type ATP synthase delta subunit